MFIIYKFLKGNSCGSLMLTDVEINIKQVY